MLISQHIEKILDEVDLVLSKMKTNPVAAAAQGEILSDSTLFGVVLNVTHTFHREIKQNLSSTVPAADSHPPTISAYL